MSDTARVGTELLAEGAIFRVVLDSPPGNVLDRRLIGLLDASLARPLPPQARMLLLEGAGKHFSFGASVPEHVKEMAGELLGTFHRLIGRLVDLPVATAALVRGQCLGGGLELAAAKAARLSLTRRVKDDLPLLEKVYLDDLMSTHDANVGLVSFLEKRKPAWSHR